MPRLTKFVTWPTVQHARLIYQAGTLHQHLFGGRTYLRKMERTGKFINDTSLKDPGYMASVLLVAIELYGSLYLDLTRVAPDSD
jgi:hypothetical protein